MSEYQTNRTTFKKDQNCFTIYGKAKIDAKEDDDARYLVGLGRNRAV